MSDGQLVLCIAVGLGLIVWAVVVTIDAIRKVKHEKE